MADSEGVSKRFDPRFSPAFQPGYDARVHREEPPSAPLREEPRADWSDVRTERPVFALPESEATVINDEVAMDEGALPWWRGFNPWFIVLWVLGIAFIIGALSASQLLQSFVQLSTDTSPAFASYVYQMVTLGSPMLIVLGLATLTSTIVILAARWRRG